MKNKERPKNKNLHYHMQHLNIVWEKKSSLQINIIQHPMILIYYVELVDLILVIFNSPI